MNYKELHSLAIQAMKDDVYPDARFPPSPYYRFLRRLAEAVKPDVSVELGVCGGGSSLHLALGHPEGYVLGIDIREEYPDNIRYVQQTCKNFYFYKGDSIEAACMLELVAGVRQVDILFIDTVHTYDRTMMEFYAWQEYLVPESYVVLDDLFREGMVRAWDELPGSKARFDFLHTGGSKTDGGFGVIYDL